jgi:pimeloyl-ACP methyl ester carboxylesterase
MGERHNRYVERGTIQGVEWMRSRSRATEAMVIAPPLIGGHALQQLRLLRPLVRRGLDIFSFSYAGHGASNGSFSIQASVDNSMAVLDLAAGFSRSRMVPLYGIASCYAAMPLLHAIQQHGEPLEKLVLINALPYFQWERVVMEFYRYWRHHQRWHLTPGGLMAALEAYRKDLLPHVIHHRQAFGILSRQRVHWFRMVRDMFTYHQFKLQPLKNTSVMCVYGRHDRLLRHVGFTDWDGYEALIKRICPAAEFRRFDGDHFLAGRRVRERLIETMVNFFSFPSPSRAAGALGSG